MARRVFLLGLDGGSWNVFDHLFGLGLMPNFQRLCAEGASGVLESTIPPITPVAWTSLMTGADPGKHGIFAFRKTKPDNSYLPLPVNRLDMEIPTVFDYYREDPGFVSLNLPMSFPATPLAGRMITCMMTPQGQTDRACHPPDLLDRIRGAGIAYVIDPKLQEKADPQDLFTGWGQDTPGFIARLEAITEARMQAIHLLLGERPWTVFVAVVVGTDRIQHLCWDALMSAGEDPVTRAAHGYYRGLDGHLGGLMAALDPQDTLLVVSDHGFTRTHGSFQTNEWLRRHGWLAKREARRHPLYRVKTLLNRLGVTRARLGRFLGEARSSRLQLRASHIDWAATQAFLSGPFAIRVNLQGRETLGTVAAADYDALVGRIAAALRELRDDQGNLLIARVDLGRDLYRGEGGGQPGDVVFTFRDDLNYTAYAGELDGPVLRTDISKQGDHRRDGIVAAWGGGIRPQGRDLRLSICDVLPTLMHLSGRAVPTVCDGRVVQEWLTGGDPVAVDPDWRRFQGRKEQITYTAAQEREINDRLKALGYLADD